VKNFASRADKYFESRGPCAMEASMRRFRHLLAAALLVGVGSPSVVAQQAHVVDQATVAGVVRDHAEGVDRDRAAIRETLGRPEVQSLANKTGIDVDRLSAAVNTMSDADAKRAADAAREVNQSLVGGASTVTISTTTIIIALLVLILLIVALD
jgi:hypothetical protein